MKKLILLLPALLLVFTLFNMNVSGNIQQDKPVTADDIEQLKKMNASLKSQLDKQRTTLMNQIKQSDGEIAKLKTLSGKQQTNINDLQSTITRQQSELNEQKAELSKVPEAIKERSYIFGNKRIVAISAIVVAFLLVLVYVLSLRKKVDAFNAGLKKVEENLDQKLMKANADLKDFIAKEITSMKAMLERQTTENKNRIIALLADANQMVHKSADEINNATDVKVAALKNELVASVNSFAERLNNLSQRKSL